MVIKRVMELKPQEAEAFKIINDMSCNCDNCRWCPFCRTDAMGSDCMIDMVIKAYREGDIQINEENTT